ncbi:MAG: oxidoreductase [Pseudopedobacter saltans]|uniref:Oxidoreductase n=1 Tax=Pseudopedobacter saltans TaxID=151895 RepID=A0A2W5FC72_9SPHI|nr:MAG: oxidoreductase [Pseudopedobacter saltans]
MEIYQVDAFASHTFGGNPAAVCILDQALDKEIMQSIAMENNVSETAYVWPIGENNFHLKWFTPELEIELCGHATLASAHILWETGRVSSGKTISFETLSGTLKASQKDNWITLDFPVVRLTKDVIPSELEAIFPTAKNITATASHKYIVELEDEKAVRNYNPDFELLKNYNTIITAQGDDQYDFVSRFFAIPVGVPEDPVTGSAHCVLAPYWESKLDKNIFVAYQASKRGGELQIKISDGRVFLSGKGITVIKGTFYI